MKIRISGLASAALVGLLALIAVAGFLTITGSFIVMFSAAVSSVAFVHSLTALFAGVGAAGGGSLGLICCGVAYSKPGKKESYLEKLVNSRKIPYRDKHSPSLEDSDYSYSGSYKTSSYSSDSSKGFDYVSYSNSYDSTCR